MSRRKTYRVLLIEDDLMVQEVNKKFVQNVDGFEVVGISSNGIEGLNKIKELKPDLVLVDMYMPDKSGIETIQHIRTEAYPVDIIAITAARDMETVRTVLLQGAFDYIMKPFKFERIKQSLEQYKTYRNGIDNKNKITQNELDQLRFSQEAESSSIDLPKGLNAVTLKKIVSYLSHQEVEKSTEEVAEGIGLARVTARRYLEYLEKKGVISIHIQYGGVGRPINRYRIQ
jgi:two-component system response regulator DctR